MKIEQRFFVKNNKLYNLEKTEVQLIFEDFFAKEIVESINEKLSTLKNKILCVHLPYDLVKTTENIYNEEFLALLRDFLKSLEDKNVDAIIVPQIDNSKVKICQISENSSQLNRDVADLFVEDMKHTARRIKDCESVIGFSIPKELFFDGVAEDSEVHFYIEELLKKHSHYAFFAKETDIKINCDLTSIEELPIVLF